MRGSTLLLLAVSALLGSTWTDAAAAQRPSQTVFTTVGWSEWCPPGYVLIDLETANFEWIAQLPRAKCAGANSRPVRKGEISQNQLEALRRAVGRAEEAGLILPECKEGKPSPHPVVSNAGPPYILVISSPRSSISAPNDLSCWSRPAFDLQRLVGRIFELRVRAIGK